MPKRRKGEVFVDGRKIGEGEFDFRWDRPTNARIAYEGRATWVLERLWETGRPVHRGPVAMVVMQPIGFRNGYVRLPDDHPWVGRDRLDDVAVHGGISFTGEYPAEQLTPPTDVPPGWWIGFDCAHAGDLPEPEIWVRATGGLIPPPDAFGIDGIFGRGRIWTTDEVAAQCEFLAGQVIAAYTPR